MLSPTDFVSTYTEIGEKKCRSSVGKLLLLGILAGFLIGMGGVVTNTASFAVGNTSVSKIICGALFPFGLIIVLLTGAELFTGNCLITISLLEHKATLPAMLRNLALVYAGNFSGALLLAAACAYGGQFSLSGGELAVYTMRIAAVKCSLPFGRAVLQGALCNILVCAGVMCGLCGRDVIGRAVGAYIPVAFFVICGFEHCVANMYYVPAGIFAKTNAGFAELAHQSQLDLSMLTWGKFVLGNLLPVTIGNVLGGGGFATLIWSAHHKS